MSWRSGPELVTKIYEFDMCHVGNIIGREGCNINKLRKIADVMEIICDTKSSQKTCFLEVQALHIFICEKVYSEIQNLIAKQDASSLIPNYQKTFNKTTKYEHQNKSHISETNSWRSERRLNTKIYEFDICHASTIIGKRRCNIKRLRNITGVVKVTCDTKTSPTTCFLEVVAHNLDTCEEVHSRIQSSIESLITKIYQFDIYHARTIIGRGGWRIKLLKKFAGVVNITLDTVTSPTTCFIEVQALHLSACEEVYSEIQRWITNQTSTFIVAKRRKIFIEAKKKENEIVLTLYKGKQNTPVVVNFKHHYIYFFDRFETSEKPLGNSLVNSPGKTRNKFFTNFSPKGIKRIFEEALNSVDFSKNIDLELKFLTGKIIFVGAERCETQTLYRELDGNVECISKPVFITFLNPLFRDQLFASMVKDDFYNVNKDGSDMFTVVHLYSESKKKMFSVKLALDENLDEYKDLKDDIRITDEKKEEIARVLNATTVGEVLSGTETVKILYRKLTLLLHPDRNYHLGAAEAFKKLQHAYNTIKDGKSKSTMALEIKQPAINLRVKPPKVISVATGKTKLCTVTMFSDAVLDLRATIVSSEKNYELSRHMKNVLDKCWEERDLLGGISTPDNKTGIYIDCVKQITAQHIWVKEITTSTGSFLFEITVNEIREKINHQTDWQECIEINLKINTEERDFKDITATDLMEEFLKIKEEWKNICPRF